jgi:hypothetical protein
VVRRSGKSKGKWKKKRKPAGKGKKIRYAQNYNGIFFPPAGTFFFLLTFRFPLDFHGIISCANYFSFSNRCFLSYGQMKKKTVGER